MLKRQPPIVVQNYLQQSRRAEEELRLHFKRLEAEGWVYDPATGTWTHPLLPGQEISQ